MVGGLSHVRAVMFC